MKGGSVWEDTGLVLGTVLVKSDSSLMNTRAKWHNGIYGTEWSAAVLCAHMCSVVMSSCRVGSSSLLRSSVQLKRIWAFQWSKLAIFRGGGIGHLKVTTAQSNCSQNTGPSVCFIKGRQGDWLWRFGSLFPQEKKNHSFGLCYFFLYCQTANIDQEIFCW